MFDFNLFDVGHGFCAYLECPNGMNALFDCGYETGKFYPSSYLKGRGISRINKLFLSHFDQDHVCDLPDIQKVCTIDVLSRNPTFPANIIREVKAEVGLLTSSMASAIAMHETYTSPVANLDYGGVGFFSYFNSYPAFEDTNNLSLVTFIEYDGLNIIVPGDIKSAGWGPLLAKADFVEHLKKVNVFIASHHGRNEGYCAEVFEHCTPDIIILSDKNIVHASQEHDYAKHSTGLNFGPNVRYVLTTRSDGHIRITKVPGQRWLVTINA